MQPFQRPQFICSAIEMCQETVNCCPHKQPHIKDERCVPRECRYAPCAENIDCDPYDPAHPRAPVPVSAAPAKTVEQNMKERKIEDLQIPGKDGKMEHWPVCETIKNKVPCDVEPENCNFPQNVRDAMGCTIPAPLTAVKQDSTKEQDIKEAVKKASQKPAKAPKKTQGRKKGE